MSSLEGQFRELASWADGSSPLYAAICRGVATDRWLLELADSAPDDRATPNLLLAAVNYLLADRPSHPLAAYYPGVVDDPSDPDDDLLPAFRSFCREHEPAIRRLLETRRTQTNSVRRCAVLYPALAHVAARTDGPLALVELGPSAGLNLRFDRYRYDYDGTVVGADDPDLTVATELRGGDPPLPESPPSVRSRVGIDRNPLDVTDDDVADWLRALIWPEHRERRATLDAALAAAREDPPPLVEGDLLDDLPAVLSEVPDDVPVCVYSTLVLYQVPEAVRDRLRERLADRMGRRPLHWLASSLLDGESIELAWTGVEDGAVRSETLAAFEQHGAWVDWRPSGV